MATNLNKLVGKIIAKPRIGDYTLYARVDGQMEIEGKQKAADEKYLTLIKKKNMYNSPDNLRRLFITNKAVYYQFFHSYVNATDKTLLRKNEITSKEIADIDFRRRVANQSPDLMQLVDNNLYTISTATGDNYTPLTGTGLRAIYKPWVYNNIEEIYVDWLPFTTKLNAGGTDFSSFGNLNDPKQLQNILLQLLCESCDVSSLEEVLTKYPRLHTIGYVYNLAEYIEANKQALEMDDFDLTIRTQSFAQKVIPNYKTSTPVLNLIQLRPQPSMWMPKYLLKEGIYKFDGEVLKGYFSKLTNKYMTAMETKNKTSEETEETATELQLLGKQAAQILECYGETSCLMLIQTSLAFHDYTLKDLILILEGEETFKNLLPYIKRLDKNQK